MRCRGRRGLTLDIGPPETTTVRYAIATHAANRRLWVLTRDDVQLGLYQALEPAIDDALQQLRADRRRGGDPCLFVNGIEVIVRSAAAAAVA